MESKAFVLEPGRIYLNKKGKFPQGSVTKTEEKEIIEELKTLFYELNYKKQRVIKKVFEKEEIYSGKMRNPQPATQPVPLVRFQSDC